MSNTSGFPWGINDDTFRKFRNCAHGSWRSDLSPRMLSLCFLRNLKPSRYQLVFSCLPALVVFGILLWGNSAQAISLAGSKTARIFPQEDVRRFLGYGPTTGQYVDSERKIDLEGEAFEATLWHRRGSWNFTQSVGLSYYQMDGSQAYPATAETVTIDYNRLTLNFSLGYAFDFGFVDVHPQYMLGFGDGNFGFTKEGNGVVQELDMSNPITVRGPQILFHFDLSEKYFVGLKYAEYGNVGTVIYEDDEGIVKQNKVYMLIFGYRVKKTYSVYSRDRAWHSGVIDWFGY